jgi:Tol biopolymer transport system component
MVDRGSHVLRLASEKIGQPEAMLEYVTEGQQPAVSYDGRWLAFLREDHGQTTIWRSHDGSEPQNLKGTPDQTDVLEMTITNDGDIIAATGSAASPHLSLLPAKNGEEKSLYEIGGAVRYPAVSPDSARLAFSRRETGSWHLFVRDLSTGTERRLTSGACNASSAAWEDSRTLLYATDCGRGYGLGAVARIVLNE